MAVIGPCAGIQIKRLLWINEATSPSRAALIMDHMWARFLLAAMTAAEPVEAADNMERQSVVMIGGVTLTMSTIISAQSSAAAAVRT